MNHSRIRRASATLAAAALTITIGAQVTPAEAPGHIIQRAVELYDADWRATAQYDYCERDDDGGAPRTYDVTMEEGTPYKRLVAVSDRSIPPSRSAEEQLKLERARADRRRESPSDRRKRLNAYQRTHARILALFDALPHALVFSAGGSAHVDSLDAYVLNGKPRPGYAPPTRDARALAGMNARFWIDMKTNQWTKLRASVIRPVSIVGFQLVRIEPETTIEMERGPVEPGVWLTNHLRIEAKSRVMFLVRHHTFYDERDFDYRRTSAHKVSTCDASR
jgi:hypothetical protein